ncbi:MAG TPA: hypothetical protein VFX14_13440 [Methylomirabilota bacterium]|nr:hypothetical protein [Methylomirabilota bacterium]
MDRRRRGSALLLAVPVFDSATQEMARLFEHRGAEAQAYSGRDVKDLPVPSAG